jgi:hypothetical protein
MSVGAGGAAAGGDRSRPNSTLPTVTTTTFERVCGLVISDQRTAVTAGAEQVAAY